MNSTDRKAFQRLSEWQLMGLCIYLEAANQPKAGRIAVGTVILERVEHRRWDGDTVKDVILWPAQFSWTLSTDRQYIKAVNIAKNWDRYNAEEIALRGCCEIAQGLLDGTIDRDPDLAAAHCCQYLNPVTAAATRDKWLAAGMRSIKTIKDHEFFKEAA